jgi:hypothetical protein
VGYEVYICVRKPQARRKEDLPKKEKKEKKRRHRRHGGASDEWDMWDLVAADMLMEGELGLLDI